MRQGVSVDVSFGDSTAESDPSLLLSAMLKTEGKTDLNNSFLNDKTSIASMVFDIAASDISNDYLVEASLTDRLRNVREDPNDPQPGSAHIDSQHEKTLLDLQMVAFHSFGVMFLQHLNKQNRSRRFSALTKANPKMKNWIGESGPGSEAEPITPGGENGILSQDPNQELEGEEVPVPEQQANQKTGTEVYDGDSLSSLYDQVMSIQYFVMDSVFRGAYLEFSKEEEPTSKPTTTTRSRKRGRQGRKSSEEESNAEVEPNEVIAASKSNEQHATVAAAPPDTNKHNEQQPGQSPSGIPADSQSKPASEQVPITPAAVAQNPGPEPIPCPVADPHQSNVSGSHQEQSSSNGMNFF
jgi:hypothetical protein